MQTEVVEKEDSIVFSHRLVTGASASSFGIEVAKLAGVPNHVIELAKARLRDPEVSAAVQPVMTREILGATVKDPGPNKGLSKVQKGLFGLSSDDESAATDKTMIADQTLSRLAMKLESIKIHKTTPLQALNILNDLKSMLAPVQQRALFDDDVLNP
jgi:DNA mismatch repair protein MutS